MGKFFHLDGSQACREIAVLHLTQNTSLRAGKVGLRSRISGRDKGKRQHRLPWDRVGGGGGRNLVSAPIFMLREPVPRQVDKSGGPQGERVWNSLGGKDKLFSLYIP